MKLSELFEKVIEVRYLATKDVYNVRNYYKNLVLEFGDPELEDLDVPTVEAQFAAYRDRPFGHNKRLIYWRIAWKQAQRWQITEKPDPSRWIKLLRENPRERALTADEMARFEESRRKRSKSRMWTTRAASAALRVVLLTGARIREVCAMRWADIDWDAGTVKVPSKTGFPRVLMLSPAALETLLEWERQNPPGSANRGPFVFAKPERGDRGASEDSFAHVFKRICRTAGIRGVRLTDLRRSYGTFLLNTGVPMEAVSKLLGHRRMATTQRHYARLERAVAYEASREQLAALGGLGRKQDAATGGRNLPDRKRVEGGSPEQHRLFGRPDDPRPWLSARDRAVG